MFPPSTYTHTHFGYWILSLLWNIKPFWIISPWVFILSHQLGLVTSFYSIRYFPVTQKVAYANKHTFWLQHWIMRPTAVYKTQSFHATFHFRRGRATVDCEQLPKSSMEFNKCCLKKLIICYNNQLLLPLCIWRFVNYFHLKCNWFHFYHLFKFMWLFSF